MALSDSIWKDFTDTFRSIGSYIVFDQGGTIDHCTHVPGPFYQCSAGIYYYEAITERMALPLLMMLNKEFLNKDIEVVP